MTEPTHLGNGRGGHALLLVVPAADARALREELINLGVVVRNEGGKQYRRRADRPVEP